MTLQITPYKAQTIVWTFHVKHHLLIFKPGFHLQSDPSQDLESLGTIEPYWTGNIAALDPRTSAVHLDTVHPDESHVLARSGATALNSSQDIVRYVSSHRTWKSSR